MNIMAAMKSEAGGEETDSMATDNAGNDTMQRGWQTRGQMDCDNKASTNKQDGLSSADEEAVNYNHQCYICDKTFSANSNLNRHLRKIHKENVQSPYNNVRCALCESLFSSSSMYTDHLERDHKVEIVRERLTFQTREAFQDWKDSVENETTAQFIKSRGEKRSKSVNKTYYSCNRSGYYVSKARTQKALKKQGSRKINGRCPASMNVTIKEDSTYDVRFIKTHVGHDFDLKHLDLSEKDRDLIIRKLTSGVTKREIIRQIRSTAELHQNTSASSPATSVISTNGCGTSGLNGGLCHPIVINSRSSIPGCGEQQIEVVVPPMSTSVEAAANTSTLTSRFAIAQDETNKADSMKTSDTGSAPSASASNAQTPTPVSRLHLATTKDIHNIINSKHLDSKKIRHNYDLNTVDAWISELNELEPPGSSPILLYKDQESLVEGFPKLHDIDFMLAIMKEGQAELLKQLGPKCIVIDSTHQVHCECLHVTYLSVIDDEGKSFPVAYLLSSRTDLDVLEVFFTLIKERVGTITTRMLIADDLHDFYQAWWRVMSMPVHNLLTPWSVFESLSKKFDLIKNRDKLRKFKKQFRALLTETESDRFTSCLNQILSDYKKDQDTCKFIEAFDEQFAKNPDIWSNSLRKAYNVSNYQLWFMHDKFKTVYKEGKNSRKMCKYITCLMNLFEPQQLEKLTQVEEANREAKRRANERRHKKGIETGSLVYEVAVEPAYWLCPSECSSEVYDEVRLNSDDGQLARPNQVFDSNNDDEQKSKSQQNGATDSSARSSEARVRSESSGKRDQSCCESMCQDCQTCRHEYKCTCLDYVVGLNMCKHIHRISALCKQG